MSYQGLQKQTVSLRIAGGVNEDDDAFLGDLPTVLEAENVRHDAKGAVAKRYGSRALTTTDFPTGSPNSLHDHKGSLVAWHAAGAYALDESANDWRATGARAPRPSRVLTDPIARGNNNSFRSDVVIVGNLMCVAWEESTSDDTFIRYQFVDITDGKLQILSRGILGDGEETPPKRAPRILVIDSSATLVLMGISEVSGNGTVYAGTYTISSNTYEFGTTVSLVGQANTAYSPTPATSSPYDVATDGGSTYCLVTPNGNDTVFRECDNTGPTGTTITATSFRAWGLCHNAALSRYVAIGASLGTWGYTARIADDFTGAATVAAITSYTPAASVVFGRATICQADESGNMFAAYSGLGSVAFPTGGTTTWCGTDIISLNGSTNAATRSGHVPGLSIAARAVYLYPINALADVALPLCEQVGVEGAPVAGSDVDKAPLPYGVIGRPAVADDGTYHMASWGRFLQDQIAKTNDHWHLSSCVASPSDEVVFSATTLVEFAAGTYSSSLSTSRRQIDLVRALLVGAPPQRSVVAQSLRIMAGGAGSVCYDGFLTRELSPPPFPIALWLDEDSSFPLPGGGFLDDGDGNGGTANYAIKLLWRYRDSQGNLHRGAPSPKVLLDLTAVSGSLTEVPRLTFPGPGTFPVDELEVEVYQAPRTADTDYYLVGVAKPDLHPSFEGLYTVSVSPKATTSLPARGVHLLDATSTLLERVALYTATEVTNTPPPPALDVCSTQSRLWCVSGERRLQVWYTKPIVDGRAPEWSASLVTSVPDEGGDCTGIASLDDKVVVFKERLAYVLFGDPGDAGGTGSTLQTARKLQGDVGCIDARSIVEGPFGVAFLSERGFVVLDRGLGFTELSQLRSSAPASVVGGVLVPGATEVRWFTSTGVLVWNYEQNVWSTHDTYLSSGTGSPAPVCATLWRGDCAQFLAGQGVFVETPDTWTAGTTYDAHEMSITTSWVKLAGLQGYKRVWRVSLLGRHFSGGLTVEVGYDYDPTWTDTFTWSQLQLASLRESDGKVQLVIRPTRQKCESIRFRFTEDAAPVNVGQIQQDNSGRGMELVGLDMECGVKKGTHKRIASGGVR